MIGVAKLLMVAGCLITLMGGLLYVVAKLGFTSGLPGDIVIKRENFTVIFPITTCILLSLLLTLALRFLEIR